MDRKSLEQAIKAGFSSLRRARPRTDKSIRAQLAVSEKTAAPLLQGLQKLRRDYRRTFDLEVTREGSAITVRTDLLLVDKLRRLPHLSFRIDGSKIASNADWPPTLEKGPYYNGGTWNDHGLRPSDALHIAQQSAKIRHGQTLEHHAQLTEHFQQVAVRAKPLLEGLRMLRQRSGKQLGFRLQRCVDGNLEITTNIFVEVPYDEWSTQTRPVAFIVSPKTIYSYELGHYNSLTRKPENIKANQALRRLAALVGPGR
jgi:hypothetical protein